MDTLHVLATIGLVLWIVLSVAVVVGMALMVPAWRHMYAMMRRFDRMLGASEGKLEPALQNLERVTDDVQYVTASLRTDVQAVGRTVERATESVESVLDMAETRAAELNGLLEIVQEEAEETFLSTASVLRAIRGARRGRGKRSGRRRA